MLDAVAVVSDCNYIYEIVLSAQIFLLRIGSKIKQLCERFDMTMHMDAQLYRDRRGVMMAVTTASHTRHP